MDKIPLCEEEVTIHRNGKSIAQPMIQISQNRELGFHPVAMTEDLLEPTDL